MKLDPPQLRVGPLSGGVWCVTHGKVIKREGLEDMLEASVKYDVTDQVHQLLLGTLDATMRVAINEGRADVAAACKLVRETFELARSEQEAEAV